MIFQKLLVNDDIHGQSHAQWLYKPFLFSFILSLLPMPTTSSTMVYFLDEPTGLGHLRVTDALRQAMPKQFEYEHIRLPSSHFVRLHALSSGRWLKSVQEFFQYGIWQNLTAKVVRFILWQQSTKYVQHIMRHLYREPHIKTVYFIATHFAPAHKLSFHLAQVRQRFPHKNIKLIVQVTDDSPQYVWSVPNADLIFVPSRTTQGQLVAYAERNNHSTKYAVNSYPISPHLVSWLSPKSCQDRLQQFDPHSKSAIQVCVPISGAVVGVDFLRGFMQAMHAHNPRFIFHIVCVNSHKSTQFLTTMRMFPYVRLYIAKKPEDAIELYEQVYKQTVVGLEVTKPSEQAFKTLTHTAKRGGVSLLFTTPVGRQEYDNIEYLRRHKLIPTDQQQHHMFEHKEYVSETSWRGYRLPTDPNEAAMFVQDLLLSGQLLKNMSCDLSPVVTKDMQDQGATHFWEKVLEVAIK